MSMSFSNSGLDEMIEWFETVPDRKISETKRDLSDLMNHYETDVRDVNTPSGPSHRKEYKEGDLRRSVSLDSDTHGPIATWEISVGGPDIDYLRYAAAAAGVELFRGADAVEAEGDEIMHRHWGER